MTLYILGFCMMGLFIHLYLISNVHKARQEKKLVNKMKLMLIETNKRIPQMETNFLLSTQQNLKALIMIAEIVHKNDKELMKSLNETLANVEQHLKGKI